MQKLYLALCGPCTWKTAIKLFKPDFFFFFFGITGETERPDDLSGPSQQGCLDKTSSISCNHVSAEILLWWGSLDLQRKPHHPSFDTKTKPFFPRDQEASKTPIFIFQPHRDSAVPAACWKKPRARRGGRRQGAERAPPVPSRLGAPTPARLHTSPHGACFPNPNCLTFSHWAKKKLRI